MDDPAADHRHRDFDRRDLTSYESKRTAIEALSVAFKRGSITILPDDILVGELESGLLRYGAPEGMHDDTVMALAMASSGTVSYKAEDIFVSELQTKGAPW